LWGTPSVTAGPAPSWTSQDIGAVAAAGSYTENGDSIVVNASGADIWGTADEFHYVYHELVGDGEIVARVVSLTYTNEWTKAAVMMRESLASNSAFAMMLVSAGRGADFEYRTAAGLNAGPSGQFDGTSTAPVWVRLERAGNEIRGYKSANGVDWTLYDQQTIGFSETVLIGLAVTSHSDGQIATAEFDNVSVTLPAGSAGSGTSDVGDYPNIEIGVSDGSDVASLPEFTITVVGLPNQPPTISGTPAAQVMVGTAYDFTPTASDPDGDALNFAIIGKPDWANFNASTGRLSGTPASGDEGTYTNVRISVSDGSESATLADFDVTVVAQVAGSVNLSWTAPTKNDDGTDLTDLAGFKVRYGPAVDNYTNVDTINDPTVTTHLVENLAPGTWFFVVTAFNTSENESAYSGFVSKVVSPP
jgi:hypothetical protein